MKTGKKVGIAVLCIFLIVVLVAGFILMPRHGSRISAPMWYGVESYDAETVQTLQKEEGKPFKILQLTDLQLDVPFKDKTYLRSSIEKMVTENDPDLIVLTGDNVAGVLMHFHIDTVVSLMDSFGIPWAVVFGNHDREFGNNLNYQAQKFLDAEHCLFDVGPASVDGLGNYVIQVEENGHAVYSLFMLDSHGEIYTDTEKYFDALKPSQVQWYADNVEAIRQQEGHTVPSMAFFHIPVPEYHIAYNLAESGSDEAELLAGTRRENECVSRDNSGFFDVFRENGGTHMFAGHDHTNNYIVRYQGVTLAYGTKTGDYSGYDENSLGGTLITIGNADTDYSVTVEHLPVPLT